jgi:regulatory protein
MNDISAIKKSALALLARREHGRDELKQKLLHKGFALREVEEVLNNLKQDNWQSDSRFTEMYVRSRAARGYGPIRIKMELRERGVNDTVISECIDEKSEVWFDLAKKVCLKKFGSSLSIDIKNRAKQQQFLQYRGFNYEQINSCVIVD